MNQETGADAAHSAKANAPKTPVKSGKSKKNAPRKSQTPIPNVAPNTSSQSQIEVENSPQRTSQQGQRLRLMDQNENLKENQTTSKRKLASPAKNRHDNMGQTTSGSDTPQYEARREITTPARATATPLQAYAGPTFHASPAPSSLPIPKFFSRSVPDTKKDSLESMMSGDRSESSSSPSENSPTLRISQPATEHRQSVDSPLDVFFRADREEKAKSKGLDSNGSLSSPFNLGSKLGKMNYSPGSISPLPAHVRHHTRKSTDGSTGNIFSMDTESSDDNGTPTRRSPQNHSTNGISASSSMSSLVSKATDDERQRKAKTLALKKLLLSPPPQHPPSSSANSGIMPPPNSSDTSELSPQRHQPIRTTSSGSSTPTKSPPAMSAGLPHPNIHSQSFTALQQSHSSTIPNQGRQRPASSHLRQEVPMHEAPEGTPQRYNLRSTPNSTQTNSVGKNYLRNNQKSPMQNQVSHKPIVQQSNASPFTSYKPTALSTSDAITADASTGASTSSNQECHQTNNIKIMEDDLRKILKLG
ncbi:hypothetical protein MMC09_002330 [Bachmanniomyces sp. S44760]|nr:hypothetical protein [Bachmanniomyces sp. S44760]